MTDLELLENEAAKEELHITDYSFTSNRIKGLYCDGTVALSKELKTSSEKICVLAEELGHYHTTIGDIISQSTVSDRKQELRARAWAYNKLIGLSGIVDSYKHGCFSLNDTAEYLDVTEEFLLEAIQYYKSKYGIYATLDNYAIYFEPSLGVFELV